MKFKSSMQLSAVIFLMSCGGGPKEITRGHWFDSNAKEDNPNICIMKVEDGQERNGEIAHGSGSYAQFEFVGAFQSIGITAVASRETSLESALEFAKSINCHYVLTLKIVEWENNATEWTGNPDAASINADLYLVKTGKLVANYYGRKRGTYSSMGPAKPDRFVPQISGDIIEDMFSYLK